MTEERFAVKLIQNDGDTFDGALIIDEAREDFRVSLVYHNKTLSEAGWNYIDSLCKIRRLLEVENILLNCYGASRNVRPSGMSIDMCGGVAAHQFTLGKRTEHQDLVTIWETGPDVDPATVDEQEEFYQKWLQSIGIDPNHKYIPQEVCTTDRLSRWFPWILLGLFFILVIMSL